MCTHLPFLQSLVAWFTGGVTFGSLSSHSQHLCLGHSPHMHAWLLACSCLATTTTTTMAINTLALHCTTLHMTPFIGMHGWVHVCKCLLCLCPDVLEEIQLTGSIVSLSPWPGSGSGRPAPLQDACCYHAPTDSPFVPPCPKPSGC